MTDYNDPFEQVGEIPTFDWNAAAKARETGGAAPGLTDEERTSLLVCPSCGGAAHSHTHLSRGLSGTCDLDIMGVRAAAVERIITDRLGRIYRELSERIDLNREAGGDYSTAYADGMESARSHLNYSPEETSAQ